MTSKVLQELDLSQRPFGEDFLAEDIGDFLDSNSLSCLGIGSCTAKNG